MRSETDRHDGNAIVLEYSICASPVTSYATNANPLLARCHTAVIVQLAKSHSCVTLSNAGCWSNANAPHDVGLRQLHSKLPQAAAQAS